MLGRLLELSLRLALAASGADHSDHSDDEEEEEEESKEEEESGETGCSSDEEDEASLRRRYEAAASELPSGIRARLLPPGPARAAAAAAAEVEGEAEEEGEEEEEAWGWIGGAAEEGGEAASALVCFARGWEAAHPVLARAVAPRGVIPGAGFSMAAMRL